MVVVTILPDKRVIARAALTSRVVAAAGHAALAPVAITDLKTVEYILKFNFITSPDTYVIDHDASITGNVVGVTVYAGAGTTISGEVICVGF